MSLATWQEWQPQSDPDEPVVASAFKEKLTAFNQSLSKVSHQAKTSSSTELEELNAWLCDPILRREAMARVMRSERYTVEFDDEGEPMRVVEIKKCVGL